MYWDFATSASGLADGCKPAEEVSTKCDPGVLCFDEVHLLWMYLTAKSA